MTSLALHLNDDEADLILLALQPIISGLDEDLSDLASRLERQIIDLTSLPEAQPEAGPLSIVPAAWPALVLQAMDREGSIEIVYGDRRGAATTRIICPILLDHRDAPDTIVAYCERRRDFRQFRIERIGSVRPTGAPYSRRLRLLRAEWASIADIDDVF